RSGCDALADLFLRQREVTGGDRAGALRLERRLDLGANSLRLGTAGMEAAGPRRISWTRDVPGRHLAAAASRERRVGNRNRRTQGSGVGVARMAVERVAVS